jgi:nucleotide sugar dehydrogenase
VKERLRLEAGEPVQRNVAVLGLGYVGLPLALAAAGAGHRVTGFDVDGERIERLAHGLSDVEDVSDLELKQAVVAGRVQFTIQATELASADTFVICVPTPLTDQLPDLSMVLAAVSTVGDNLEIGDLVILESTTYPGTTEEVVAPQLQRATGLVAGRDFGLVFSPERIDPGNASFDLRNTTKIIGGSDWRASQEAARFYGSFIDSIRIVARPREAEMAKLLENTYRHVNIALVNEMAVFCNELNIDLWEVIEAASTKPFGFMPFWPGPGVGGHCIPIDPSYLSWSVRRLGYSFRFVELATEINHRMPDYIATRIGDMLNEVGSPVKGRRILLLGVAYKRDVGDIRESTAFMLARRLLARGATVTWHDPYVSSFAVDGTALPCLSDLTTEAVAAEDVVVIHTDHTSYDWASIVNAASLVFDARNVTAGIDDPRITRL